MSSVLTNVGIAGIITKLNTTTPPKWIGWGTGGSVTPDPADTTLESESAEDRVEGDNSIQQGVVAGDTYQVVGTLETESEQTISEIGLFSADENGDMFGRASFTGIALNTGEAIQFTVKLRIGNPT